MQFACDNDAGSEVRGEQLLSRKKEFKHYVHFHFFQEQSLRWLTCGSDQDERATQWWWQVWFCGENVKRIRVLDRERKINAVHWTTLRTTSRYNSAFNKRHTINRYLCMISHVHIWRYRRTNEIGNSAVARVHDCAEKLLWIESIWLACYGIRAKGTYSAQLSFLWVRWKSELNFSRRPAWFLQVRSMGWSSAPAQQRESDYSALRHTPEREG